MRAASTLAQLLFIAGAFAFSAALLFGFTADDAYILYRYVENLHRLGELVYNAGERVSSLTSPLHAILLSALYGVTGESALSNKLLGLGLTLTAAGVVGLHYRQTPSLALLGVALATTSPFVVLWTFGGLGTPLLLLLVTAATLAFLGGTSARRMYWLCWLCGLGFLARYDAVLYFAPLALAALVRLPRWRQRLIALGLGAALPLVWLSFAFWYYGDILPTSYYIKPPVRAWGILDRNGLYLLCGLTTTGLLPALLLWYLHGRDALLRDRLLVSASALWPVHLGLALELLYGLTMATHHMMFSYRMLVPYLPAAALIVVETLRLEQARGLGRVALGWRRQAGAFVLALCAFHAFGGWLIYARSLNPYTPVGEWRAYAARELKSEFERSMWNQAEAIRQDWLRRPASALRPPRIYTYLGGVVPYALPEAYIFEALASFRHGAPQYRNWARFADYSMAVVPYFGPVETQIGPGSYELIFEETLDFDGRRECFRVYHNPDPAPHSLGNRIDRCCLPPAGGRE